MTVGRVTGPRQGNQDTSRQTATAAAEAATAGALGHGGTIVADLPVAPEIGARSFVTDALAPVFLAVAVGGGAIGAPVVFDGTDWLVG